MDRSSPLFRFLGTIRSGIREMMPYHLIVLCCSCLVLMIAAQLGAPALAHGAYAKIMGLFYLIVLPGVLLLVRLLLKARASPGGTPAPEHGEGRPERLGRLAAGLVTLGMFTLFMGSFTTFKSLMPQIAGGFSYDRLFADLDFLLHGSRDPGTFLLSAIGTPPVMAFVEWHYGAFWTAMAFIPAFFIALLPGSAAFRLRYFLSMFLVWTVLGNVLALLFLSAGPVFYGEATGDHQRFADFLAALSGDSPSATFRSYLWQGSVNGTVGFGTGISAFPSVHVGVATMNALFLREYGPKAGLAGLVHLVVILASSVLLGWHYAIDGYVSILVVLLMHMALKRVLADRAPAPARGSPTPATP